MKNFWLNVKQLGKYKQAYVRMWCQLRGMVVLGIISPQEAKDALEEYMTELIQADA